MTSSSLTSDQIDELLLSGRYGDLEDLQQTLTPDLLTAEVLATIKNDNDNTLLHYACANGHTEVVQFLLPYTTLTLILAQNDAGNTPLHWAGLNGHLDTVKLLVSAIEALETKQPDEAKRLNVLFHPQTTEQSSQTKDVANDDDANVNDGSERKLWDVRNKAGRGPMSEAQMREQESVVKYLLERMIDGPESASQPEATATSEDSSLSTQTADLKIDS